MVIPVVKNSWEWYKIRRSMRCLYSEDKAFLFFCKSRQRGPQQVKTRGKNGTNIDFLIENGVQNCF